jgi:hypothetical protein
LFLADDLLAACKHRLTVPLPPALLVSARIRHNEGSEQTSGSRSSVTSRASFFVSRGVPVARREKPQ